jgi:hypothetical protein
MHQHWPSRSERGRNGCAISCDAFEHLTNRVARLDLFELESIARIGVIMNVSARVAGGHEMALFEKTLVRASETRSFQIRHTVSEGWQSSEFENDRVARQQQRSEWHRVERDLARFTREIEELHRQGWRDA